MAQANISSISIDDPKFAEKIVKAFKRDGVAVISNVFDPKMCDQYMDSIVGYFEKLASGLDRNDLKTWTDFNCPPQTRKGLFQCLVSNAPAIWEIRANPNVRKLFTELYSGLRKKEITDFVVSNDGINIRPNKIGPFYNPQKDRDWAHLDYTSYSEPWHYCIQGQAVLTNTTAAFRCSLKSHKVHHQVLEACGVEDKDTSNWCKFKPEQIPAVKKIVEESGATWQVPILAPKGSFIVWSSATIHSAKHQDYPEDPSDDPWQGWRGVVYVCYRPREDFSKRQLSNRMSAVVENRVTNHWATRKFPKHPSAGRFKTQHHAKIMELLESPTLVYQRTQVPVLSPEQQALV